MYENNCALQQYFCVYASQNYRYPPPLSLSHTFGVVPRKLGWKPTYYSPQLSS